ncbi:hypothetical protein [Streptomyces tubercidicus]|uniref:hypothetical protein n=1 Tax=Streptomyces tubercidicus TaxID=47759 RepID=UPI003466B84F
MSAHQPFPTRDGQEGVPDAAAGRDAHETPTMNELLAACAAATAVSTPPDTAAEAPQGEPAGPADEPQAEEGSGPGTASTGSRDAA